jgi:tetratricopeptide (TPR) repeat protein/tRNA A-37 threonylcarbamoyl transferase component Bud32
MGQTYQREAAIFDAAMDLPPGQRARYLDEACGEDAAFRRRMESLVSACDSKSDVLDSSAVSEAASAATALMPSIEKAGDRIGRYKLLQQIGEGGCGVVYMAEQLEPVRRRVALKVIKLGLDTKAVVARFEAERQALALMDHPNIAKVLDAGATDTGRPYFVMDLVRGVKITEYCDEKKLSTRERLDLFIQVCGAIQHAHQKGIIHRDIKPSNILVSVNDGVTEPKVIDFGVAKATSGQQLTDKTLFTAFEQFIGTPAYMSPEQAVVSNVDIDTRSDIYALGVLLYELLTGKTPFDAKELLAIGLDELRRKIREAEPQRPSTRLSTLADNELSTTAQRRGLEAPKLVSELRGDLDWIVMKCLEKDRARRYETANGLSLDIQRHLKHEPVVACPPGSLYRLQKLVRRNKLVFAAGAGVVAALLFGLGISTWMFVKERTAVREQSLLRQKAQAEAARSQEVAQFLKETLKGLGPSVAWDGDRTLLQEMLRQMAERIGRGLTNQPDIAISLRLTLAETYEELGLYEPERQISEQALLFAESSLGKESLLAANSATQLGWAEWRLNKLAQAEQHLRQGLELRRKLLGSEHALVADSLGKLSFVLANRKRPTESVNAAREAHTISKKLFGDNHPEVARSLAALGTVLRMAGRHDEAEPFARQALALHRRLLGDGHYDTTTALNKLAMVLMGQRKYSEAESLMRESLATQKKLLGEKHPELVLTLNLLGQTLSERKQAEAEAVYREALEQQKKLHGDEDPAVAQSLDNLASALGDQGRHAEAEAIFSEALAMRKRLHGDEHPDVARSLENLGIVLGHQGKHVEAEAMHRKALTMRKKLLSDEHPDVGKSLFNLAFALHEQDKLADAETTYLEALTLQRKLGGGDPSLANSLNNLGNVFDLQGKYAEAEVMHREALDLRKKLFGDAHAVVAQSLDNLAVALKHQNKLAHAEAMYREALAVRKKLLGDKDPAVADSLQRLASACAAIGKHDEALPLYKEVLKLNTSNLGPYDRHTLGAMSNLATAYRDTDDLEQAVPLFEETLKLMNLRLKADDPFIAITMDNLAVAYARARKFDEAIRLRNRLVEFRKANGGPDDPDTLAAMNDLALAYRDAGKLEQALPLLEDTLKLRTARLGPEDVNTFDSMNNLAVAYGETGKLDLALSLHEQTLKLRKAGLGPDHENTRQSINNLAWTYRKAGKRDRLEALYREQLADGIGDVLNAKIELARLLLEVAKTTSAQPSSRQDPGSEAEQLVREYLDGARSRYANAPLKLADKLADLAEYRYRQGNYVEAEPLYRELVELRRSHLSADHKDVIEPTASLARVLTDWAWAERTNVVEPGNMNLTASSSAPSTRNSQRSPRERAREAERLLREVLTIRLRDAAHSWRTGDVKSRLGAALVSLAATDSTLDNEGREAKLSEAESLLLEGCEEVQRGATDDKYKRDALQRLVRLYEVMDRPEQRAEWEQKLDAAQEKQPASNSDTAAADTR